MLTRRTLLTSAGAALALGPLAGCAAATPAPAAAGKTTTLDPKASASLTMTWWGTDDRANKFRAAIAEFNKQYPNITVQPQFSAFNDYWTARNTEAAGNALPDVMQFDSSFLRQYANNNRLLALDDYVGGALDFSNVGENLVASGRLNGKLYAVPTGTNTLAMFYHPGVLAKLGMEAPRAGYTWEDLRTAIVDGAAAGAAQDPRLYYSSNPVGVFWFFLQWVVQQGITPFKDDNSLGFTEAHVREWLTMWEPVNAPGVAYPPGRTEQLKPKGGFTVNEVGSEMSWDNFLSGYVADSGDKGMKMLPVPSGADGKPHMFSRTFQMVAGANTREPLAAATLLNFLVNDPAVGKIFGTSKGVPATKAQRDAMELKEGSIDHTVVAYEESVADLVTEPAPLPVEGFGALEAAWVRLANDHAFGRLSVDDWTAQWFQAVKENVPS